MIELRVLGPRRFIGRLHVQGRPSTVLRSKGANYRARSMLRDLLYRNVDGAAIDAGSGIGRRGFHARPPRSPRRLPLEPVGPASMARRRPRRRGLWGRVLRIPPPWSDCPHPTGVLGPPAQQPAPGERFRLPPPATRGRADPESGSRYSGETAPPTSAAETMGAPCGRRRGNRASTVGLPRGRPPKTPRNGGNFPADPAPWLNGPRRRRRQVRN